MSPTTSRWQTSEVANAFLEGVRSAIPGADLQLAVMGKIIEQWCPSPHTLVDLGCGDGILGRYLLNRFPTAQGIFADFSEPMLAAVRQKVSDIPQATVVTADFGQPDWGASVATHGPIDVVVSGFAIHHQPDDRKQAIYAEIYDLLAPGGIFLNLEHVASATAAGEALFDDFFVDHLHAHHVKADPHVKRDAIAQKYYNRPDKVENILAPVESQCQWLRAIGYRDVDCFFKTFELALLGGRK
ncbi:MAG: class I SAM-dependent methyltransferase [Leptolyngbya sp. SIOISBB]|nr:class I SAM-dependent methyltransferase [Leptolyngbya sp. SIOISBB]